MDGSRKRGHEALAVDLKCLFERARSEEQKGQKESTDCEVVISGEIYYAHSCLLCARSGFFEKALAQKMREGHDRIVELRHMVSQVPRAAAEALLLYIYTGSIDGVSCMEIAWGVCDLLGAESGDFLELSGCDELREVCTDRIMGEVKQEDLVTALLRARSLGHSTQQLRRLLLENLVWDPVRARPSDPQSPGAPGADLFIELLDVVKCCTARKPGWLPSRTIESEIMQEAWTLTGSSFHGGLQNTVEALRDPAAMDMGAGTLNQVGAFLSFEFAKPVTVRVADFGIGRMGPQFNHRELDGADLQCGDEPAGNLRQVMRLSIPTTGEIHRMPLPEPTTARYWRITYTDGQPHNIAVSYVNFE